MDDRIAETAKYLIENGVEVYEVGGSLRDSLLGRIPSDFDYAVSSWPQVTREILGKFCLQRNDASVYAVGEEYGTIGMAFSDGLKLEFTTFRGEVYPTDSRKPNVIFGTRLIDDLARRDFTINAMARDPVTGKIIDPFGGRNHLKDGILACVGNDLERFDEDPLRMLRVVRFSCQLKFTPAVSMFRPERLSIISRERIRDELSKILLSEQPDRGIKLLLSFRLMKYTIPEILELDGLEQGHHHIEDALGHTISVLRHVCKEDFGQDNLILRLAALLHDIGKPQAYTKDSTGEHFYDHDEIGERRAIDILRGLKFEEETVGRVSNLVRRHMEPVIMAAQGGLSARNASRLIRRMNTPNHYDIQLLLALATGDLASSASPRTESIDELKRLVTDCERKLPNQESPITGNEIMERLNIKPSKLVGEIKEYLVDYIVEHGNCSKEDLILEAKNKFGL
jgi:poly(A) polymerase